MIPVDHYISFGGDPEHFLPNAITMSNWNLKCRYSKINLQCMTHKADFIGKIYGAK